MIVLFIVEIHGMLCPFFFNAIIYLHYNSDTLAAFYVKNDCDDIQYDSYIDN